MKKIISIILIMSVLLSLASCKKKADTETDAIVDIETPATEEIEEIKTETPKTETKTEEPKAETKTDTKKEEDPKTETEPEPTQKEEPEKEPVKTETLKAETETKPETEVTPKPEVTPEPEIVPESEQTPVVKTDNDKGCPVTINQSFSPYEVVVLLTKEESEKGISYTPDSFSAVDAYYVTEMDDYFLEEGNIDLAVQKTLFLYLKSPSKENVLKAVKMLEQDNRVYMACPNAVQKFDPAFCIEAEVKPEYADLNKDYEEPCQEDTDRYFSEIENIKDIYWTKDTNKKILKAYIDLQDRSVSNVVKIVEKLTQNDQLKYVRPYYNRIKDGITVVITHEQSVKQQIYTPLDFPGIDVEKVDYLISPERFNPSDKSSYIYLSLKLKKPTKQNMIDTGIILKNDDRIENVCVYASSMFIYG